MYIASRTIFNVQKRKYIIMLHFSLLGLKTGKGSEKHGISLAKSDTLARNEILAYNLTFLFFSLLK